jgi:amidohydrolase
MLATIQAKAQEYYPLVQSIRHHIHSQPELSFVEYNTAAYVASVLDGFGIPYVAGVAGTGIVATLTGALPGHRCIALRSELDALPIQELNDTPYRSQNTNVMHACGHDVHTSCLLGAAKILHDIRDVWSGTIKLFFQPGEEKHPGGASLLIQAGVLEQPKPEAIYALHVYPHLPAGAAGFRAGQYMASADEIYITIKGRGGHAAMPHQTVDPISIAALVITGLQQVISRKGNPLIPSVLTFGAINGGFATNVIPEEVKILGTFRTMDETWRYQAHQYIKDFTTNTCAAYCAEAEVIIPVGYPSLFNDPIVTAKARELAKVYLGDAQVHDLNLRMAAEDFSFYTHFVPGCFFRIGTATPDGSKHTIPVHNARFDIDENAMATAMGLMAWLAWNEMAG